MRFGAVAAAITGASTLSSLTASSAEAAMQSPPEVMTLHVPTATTDLATYVLSGTGRMANSMASAGFVMDVTKAVGASGSVLTVPTGYTGNDVVEPTVLYDAAAPFLGYEYVLCIAPYYQSNAIYENPCLWVSHDGMTWVPVVNGVPTPGYSGVATPIFPNAVQGDGNLSDPTLYRAPEGTYYVLWNQWLTPVTSGGTGAPGTSWATKITKAPSLAGPWTTPVTITATNYAVDRPSTPAIFHDGTQWHLYAVDTHSTSVTAIIHYTTASVDATANTWVKQSNPAIAMPGAYSGQVWWHLNAYRIGTTVVLLIQDSKAGTSGGGNLWLVSSRDSGATWTVPTTPFYAGTNYYRSALVVANGGTALDLYYGQLGATWKLYRAAVDLPLSSAGAAASSSAGAAASTPAIYGGVSTCGLPVNSTAVTMAKIPIAPYVLGDTCKRADSTTSPGASDSGQTYSVLVGTAGISGSAMYAVNAASTKVSAATGISDGVFTCEMSVVDTATEEWFLFRITDQYNYIRLGYSGNYLHLENIVAGRIIQSFAAPLSIVATNGDVLAFMASGGNIAAYRNGVLLTSVTGWTANVGTGIGWQARTNVPRFRNLTSRPLVNGA
jgi:hypothetical protein